MMSNGRCWRRRLAALVIVTYSRTGCVAIGSEAGRLATCPPVIEYSRGFQGRATEDLASLQVGSETAEFLSDYTVMRDQARACSRP